ncbi:MAG: DNA polymerase III subunit delta [Ignavibacteria bacterium]|nr:DNA polymerase III subunit delta [Ignavibacteria bacterium]
MTYEQIISNIRNKVFHPIYFLMGEESYFIDSITEMLEEHVLEEQYRSFNQLVIYGRDVDVMTIANQARTYPMSGNYQLIIVKEAQDVKDIEKLEPYLNTFPESTILVINYKYKKLDGRKGFSKQVDKKGVLFESKKLYDNNIPDWIKKYLSQKDYTITPKACQIMADSLGTDLHRVRNELEKLMISLPAKSVINEDDVERNVGISKDFNVFELNKAIGSRNILKANQIVNYFGANSKDAPFVMVVILLYGFFLKTLKYHYAPDKSRNAVASLLGVGPFFVGDYQEAARNFNISQIVEAIAVLREYDLKSKGYGSNAIGDGELYKELIYKILH